jgi:hypothetical protein
MIMSTYIIIQPDGNTKCEGKVSPTEFETEFENILECESGAHMGSIYEKKNSGQISRATVPLMRTEP